MNDKQITRAFNQHEQETPDVRVLFTPIRQLCCSGVLVATNRMFALLTASQMASASAASFLCRLTWGFTYAGGIKRTHMTKSLQFARPMMRRGAGFDANEARR